MTGAILTDVDLVRDLLRIRDPDRLIGILEFLLDDESDRVTSHLGPADDRLEVAWLLGAVRRWRDVGLDLVGTLRATAPAGFYDEGG